MSDINREEFNAGIEASEARVARTVEGLRADSAELRAYVTSGFSEVRVDMEKMRADIHQLITAQTKWIVVIVFGALAAAGTVWGFFRSPMPSMQPVPYVIYAQPSPMQMTPDQRPGGQSVIDQ